MQVNLVYVIFATIFVISSILSATRLQSMAIEQEVSYSLLEEGEGFCKDARGLSSNSLSDVDDDVESLHHRQSSRVSSPWSISKNILASLAMSSLMLLSFWGGWKIHSPECSFVVDTVWSMSLTSSIISGIQHDVN